MQEEQEEETIILRTEIHHAYKPILLQLFSSAEVERSLAYFLATPAECRKDRTSLEMCLECCLCAKQYFDDRKQ
jgi:hypothetical protein